MDDNLDTQIVDFIDLVNYTLKDEFIDKWKFRFSSKFLKEFQIKVLNALKDRKPIKVNSLFNHLTNKCGYSREQVINFFEAIDIEIYHPLIMGRADF